MITLRQIASVHQDRFSGGDRPNKSELSYQEIIFQIRSICNELIKPVYWEKQNEGDRSAITQCIASYELVLTNDPDCAFVTLPDFYIALPFNRGVWRVYQRALKASGNPTGTEFTICHNPAINLKTRTARYAGINLCWVEGFKIKFYNLYAEPQQNANIPGTNKVIVQLQVMAPDSIGENDPLPILPEMIDKIYDRLAQFEMNPPLKVETPK
jgi:hypothetical protein